ncbi:amino acid transporter [Apiospora arundinis]
MVQQATLAGTPPHHNEHGGLLLLLRGPADGHKSRLAPVVIQPDLPQDRRPSSRPNDTMCEKHYYYAQRGNKVQAEKDVKFCVNAHHNRPCRQAVEFHHNQDERRGANTFPPSPPLSDIGVMYSGSDGDRAHKRRSSTYYSSLGGNGIEINRQPSQRQRRRSVVIDDPYRPVTPPTMYYGSSPSRGEYSSPPRRPAVKIEISNPRAAHPTTSYQRSPKSSRAGTVGSNVSTEEERIQRLEREMAKTKEALRRQQLQSKIERQNEAIKNRPAVPQAPPAPRAYRRGSVSIAQPVDQLTDAMKHVRIGNQTAEQVERERRRRERELKEREEAAQQQRLRARMERRGSTAVYEDQRYGRHY